MYRDARLDGSGGPRYTTQVVSPERVIELLERVRSGALLPDAAARELEKLPFEDLGFARVDQHRALRQGLPEVILGQGKTAPQIAAIAERLLAAGQNVLVTRLTPEVAADVVRSVPKLEYNAVARTALGFEHPVKPLPGSAVAVVSAGTSDLPVAEEAAVTLAALGDCVARVTDVGVAGIHRVLARREELTSAAVVIVIAGMDGALPSVVGGLVSAPVIAVPTSVGYGASFQGVAPLLAMLNSCAAGVTVVNIDNGFGAAVAASRITHS